MPRAPKFTDHHIRAEAKPGVPLFIRDTPNLYLLTSKGPKRKQRFILRFSRPDGKVTTRSLGSYPHVTLEMAKNRAKHNLEMIKRDKVDPWKIDGDIGPQKSYADVVKLWIDKEKPNWKTEKQHRNAELLLCVHSKALLDIPLIQIRPARIHDALIHLWDRAPNQVLKALVKITQVFDFAKSHGWYTAENPARWKEKQKHLFPKLLNAERHFNALDYDAVPAFMQKLRERQSRSVAAVALEVTILTACRSGEVLGMQWSEIDFENRLWTIPATRMKTGRKHEVPLCLRVIELLKRQREHGLSPTFVFSGYARKSLNEKAMRVVLRELGYKVTVHGFRSSFRDWAGDCTDFAREHIEACLAHKVGNQVERAYRRGDALEKRRKIMDAWAKFCG
jgi:integrase